MRIISVVRLRDGLDQLHVEHESIRQLLRGFYRSRMLEQGALAAKSEIVDCLCDTLILHAHVEEEIFYPLVRTVLGEGGAVSPAFCNHSRLLDLIASLDELEPDHRDYDETVGLIGDCVLPSMDQEQDILFAAVRRAGLDTLALGQRMALCRKTHRRDVTSIELLPRMG